MDYIDRPPRIQPNLPIEEVNIPAPPSEEGKQEGMFAQIVPMLGMVGFMLMAGAGNPVFLIPMIAIMGLTMGTSFYQLYLQRQGAGIKEKAYKELLAEMRQDMTRAHNAQRLFYYYNYPEPSVIMEIAGRKETSRFGSRLWERRPSDGDFGSVRLGVGARPSTVIYKFGDSGSPIDETTLQKDAKKLAKDSEIITNVPISVPLRPFPAGAGGGGGDAPPGESKKPPSAATDVRHSIGIFGNPTSTIDFARSLIMNFTAYHTPYDTRVYVVGLPQSKKSWEWAEWLPHCTVRSVGDDDNADKPKQFDQLCFSDKKDDILGFWKRLKKDLDQRQVRLRESKDDDSKKGGDVSLPFYVVVVDLLGEIPDDNILKEVASESVVATINQSGPTLGAAIIFLGTDATKVPSECQALIEVASVGEKAVFRYSEVGLNSSRYLGEADLVSANDAKQNFAARIRRLDILRPFGSDLPRSVDLLQMQAVMDSRKVDTVDKLEFQKNWQHSVQPKNSEWLSVPIGLVSSKEVRTLVFSAKEGGDGVHGMVAGTTGSGKSELLLTLVGGMALKYDPRIVNFVLVDYKGGAAFEPVKMLPHVVDILSNLQANAVERMFVALQAVMDQRSQVLAQSNSKDLVDYRKKVAPKLPADSPLPRTFPHLFIIIDEFGEMVAANPDYKAKFESVTRLGRAFGVSLILATQRPAGFVTDQMRSNMKFRICLRVETSEDSKELLSGPDAAFLPNLGGRGYVQVGNDVMQMIQSARAGADYTDDRTEVLRDVIWLDEEALPQAASGEKPLYSAEELAEVLGLRPGEKPPTLIDWMVGIAALRAKRDGVPQQHKPWPNPLPEYLSLTDPVDAKYLNTERILLPDRSIVIDEDLDAWLNNVDEKPLWKEQDWKSPEPLRAEIGLVDNPYLAEQRFLTIDLTSDPVILFGASGRGKSTFVKTLLTCLACKRNANELHMYALDFGRGGLKAIKALPNLAAIIDASETARVDQMFRMLRNFVNERQTRLAPYNNLADHNAKNPNVIIPEVVMVIDNFAEFKESYEHLMTELQALIRDGRAFGIYFVITASSMGDVGNKLYNILNQRLTLTLPDRTLYADIVGSGAPSFDNVPGRGLVAMVIKDNLTPLECQVGMPGRPDQMADDNQIDVFQHISQRLEKVWFAIGGKRPSAELPRSLTLLDMYTIIDERKEAVTTIGELNIGEKWKKSMLPANQEWLRSELGLMGSKEVKQLVFQAQADGVHGMAAGTTGSGKSELIQTLINSMAIRYDPRIVNFVLVDYKGGPTVEPFRKLPHAVDIATNLEGNKVERIFVAINAEMNRRSDILAKAGVADLVDYRKKVIPGLKPDSPFPTTFPHLFIIVDEFAEMITANPDYKGKFESITRLGRSFGVSLILATQRPAGVVTDQMRSNMKFRICLRVETAEDSNELLKKPDGARLPQIGGRGYVQAGTDILTEIQAAWSGAPYDGSKPDPVYTNDEILDALDKQSDPPRSVLGWLVGACAAEAIRQGIPKQFKPWPDNLPDVLPMNELVDASYLPDVDGDTVILNPAIKRWADNYKSEDSAALVNKLWPRWNWEKPLPMKANIGLVDDPFHSNQRILSVDVSQDPVVLFGASGRGKTTFIKSLLFSLAAQWSPADLNIYALDFGRGGLKTVRVLPHCGATIDSSQADRVGALFRFVRSMMNERQERLQRYASLEDYNAQYIHNPDMMFPSIVIVVDNFAEFKESYEDLMPDLQNMVRDGRQFGIYFVLAANLLEDVPGKFFNLLGQRFAFTMADPSAYSDIVGRGALSLANTPGNGLVNIEGQPLEYHVAVPVLQGEKDSYMRLAESMEKAWLAVGGKKPSAEIPRSITFLEMYQIILGKKLEFIGDLDIAGHWKKSMEPANQEWLTSFVGLISSKELRMLSFSAKAGGDGVHGMAAGTTGSGKSELIQTMISSMAVKYDPRIVNFVLVDYKGGPTVEPFRKLPHAVDVATNLEGNKVERIFVAINAEMNRRSDILAKAGVADLVEYRKKVIPTLKPDSPFPTTFPHLFIIVDEFAEMVTANPDYKAKFESITRLGRSFGVSLILATQRPSGVVTDQMRSNMKFRICLRVETTDDSKEMLGRPDASALPAIGGRGYVQVGGGGLTEVQAAWSGAPYDADRPDPVYTVDEILDAIDKQNDPPRSLLGWLVGAFAAEAIRQRIPKQFKPWPDGLPEVLPLNELVNAEYIPDIDGDQFIINPAITKWVQINPDDPAAMLKLWEPWHWQTPLPLKAHMGIVDNPFLSNQRVLTVDMGADPVIVFGGSGRGKTTFLKSLMFTLAARLSPLDFNMYALDFGRGGLKSLRILPHCGATIDASQPERVEALFRMIRGIMNERQDKLQKFANLEEYNAQNVGNVETLFPCIAVLIDNFSEFKENYEYLMVDLQTLVRDGRQFGIFFAITASQLQDIPGKFYNLLTQRFTFTLPDTSAYADIVGRGALSLANLPGRGLTTMNELPLEFHVGLPVMQTAAGTPEKDPFARLSERMDKAWASINGKRPSAEIPRAITFIDMWQVLQGRKIERIGDLRIGESWKASMETKNQEWLTSTIGLVSSKELRTLIFSAKAGGDGVHGMAAGTTGSGKSELIQTLISAMAIKYDPRIVNFVLVDYKGGPTVEPFRKLPHAVDIATNLDGNAVDRIFIAINAEMNRRSSILAKAGVADLVEYRKKVIPTLKPDSPLPDTFPHLFIIVDEFAEMITTNPDYKGKFESITRLGRSFGVSLLLATQRPSGVVSDQMRSNMKFRICLRVETAEDSKEMLGRNDASTLPALGGRGYVQVGGGALTEVQAAWAGAPYDETKPDPVYTVEEILAALEKENDPPRSFLGWLVGAFAAEAIRQNIPKQFKPWPSPLPKVLPMNELVNAEYIQKGALGKEIIINPVIKQWVENTEAEPLWPEYDWSKPQVLKAPMGIVDNSYDAEQRVLNVDPSADPIAVFGASGRGKSTYLKSLLVALGAQFSPTDLHILVLDFGRGGLKALRSLPHIGGIVDASEEDRVERFFRMIRNILDERQKKLQAYDSLLDYNTQNPDNPFPAILAIIDNVTDFREGYDKYLLDLIAMVRDGRSFGIYWVVTAPLLGDMPGKLFNIIPQRVSFTQSDPTDYTSILSRGWTMFNDEPGRGLTMEQVGDRQWPLEFHAAIPTGMGEGDPFRELSQRMAKAWAKREAEDPSLKFKRCKPIEELPSVVELAGLLPPLASGNGTRAAPLGINDNDRMPTLVDFKTKGPHWIVIGPPVTGKTTTLRSLVLSLAHTYSPEQVAFVLMDPSDAARRFYNYGPNAENTLDKLPHVLATVTNSKELDEVNRRLMAEYDENVVARLQGQGDVFEAQDNNQRSIFVIIDHYDDVGILNKTGGGTLALSEIGKGKNMNIVLGGSLGITRDSSDELRRRAEASRYTLVLNDFEAVRYMSVKMSFSSTKELPPGRGFMIKAVSGSVVHMATPVAEGKEAELEEEFMTIRAMYPERAKWSYFAKDLTKLNEAIKGSGAAVAEDGGGMSGMGEDGEVSSEGQSDTVAKLASTAEVNAMKDELASLMAELGQMEMPDTDFDPTKLNFASLEIEVDENGNGTSPNGSENTEASTKAA